MSEKYTKEQLLKLYEKLPKELQEALFSMETADHIWDICERNNVLPQPIADYVGHVLLGVLAPDEFQEALENEVNLEKEVAKKVTQEVNRFIFFPVKPALEELYKIEIAPPAKPSKIAPPPEEKPEEKLEEELEEELEEKPSVPSRPDAYREPIE